MRKYFKEFKDNDYQGEATKMLNRYIETNIFRKITVIGYSVVHYEKINQDRTYILVKVEE